MPPSERKALLASLEPDEAQALLGWAYQALPAQLAPDGDWRIWLFLGGAWRRKKPRAGAEWIAQGAARGRMRRIGLIGATMRDVRAVMVEGESGLLNVTEGLDFQPSNGRVLWPDGTVATLLSAEEPDSLRGHQFDALWGDEFAKWRDAQDALDMAQMTLRLGEDPRMLLTTTPRNMDALKALLAMPGVAVTRARTADNHALSPEFPPDDAGALWRLGAGAPGTGRRTD